MNLNKMHIDEIAKYINKELSKGRSLKDIETIDFNVNDRVIAKRLTRKGYKRVNNQYIYKSNADVLKDKIDLNSLSIKESNTKVLPKYNNIDLNKLNELMDLIEPIKEVIQRYNESKNIIEVENIDLKPKAVTEVKQKIFKVDIDVSNRWDKFVAEHKEFKVQQLISLALEEFIEKYK
jgi:hypothetical protein